MAIGPAAGQGRAFTFSLQRMAGRQGGRGQMAVGPASVLMSGLCSLTRLFAVK